MHLDNAVQVNAVNDVHIGLVAHAFNVQYHLSALHERMCIKMIRYIEKRLMLADVVNVVTVIFFKVEVYVPTFRVNAFYCGIWICCIFRMIASVIHNTQFIVLIVKYGNTVLTKGSLDVVETFVAENDQLFCNLFVQFNDLSNVHNIKVFKLLICAIAPVTGQ